MCKVHIEWTKKTPENTQKKGREITLIFFFFFFGKPGYYRRDKTHYKTKHTLIMWSSSHHPWYLLKWAENLCSSKNLHMNIHSSFIFNCQNLEATEMSFNKWIRKCMWCSHITEYYSMIKRNKLSSKPWKDMDEP